MPDLTVAELTPEETQRYNIIGVPEIAAEDLDTWTVGELAEIVEMVRSIADVCELEVVTEVLDSAPALRPAAPGHAAVHRAGGRAAVEPARRDDRRALGRRHRRDRRHDRHPGGRHGRARRGREGGRRPRRTPTTRRPTTCSVADTAADDEDDPEEEDGGGFWKDVGIDPIRITTDAGDGVTLRCFIDGKPVFLGSDTRIELFKTERALTRWIATDGEEGHDLAAASTWPDVVARAGSELTVTVEDMNTYVLTELAEDLAEGPTEVDPARLELATELLLDVGEWAGDDGPREALAASQPLGWLVSFIVKPDPTRLAPSPPFDAESAALRGLLDGLEERLNRH